MLDIDDSHSIVDDIWATAAQQTKLPKEWIDFFDFEGPAPLDQSSQRRYHRFFLRGKAIVLCGDDWMACFTKDVSRIGIGLLAPAQIFPRQVLRVWLPDGRDYLMRVARCVRVGENCYECGANFLRVTELKNNKTMTLVGGMK